LWSSFQKNSWEYASRNEYTQWNFIFCINMFAILTMLTIFPSWLVRTFFITSILVSPCNLYTSLHKITSVLELYNLWKLNEMLSVFFFWNRAKALPLSKGIQKEFKVTSVVAILYLNFLTTFLWICFSLDISMLLILICDQIFLCCTTWH
jgi:hypothetical protein